MPALPLATVPAVGQWEELTPVNRCEFCGVRDGGVLGAGAGAALFSGADVPAVPLPPVPLVVRLPLCADAAVQSDSARREAALINKRRVTSILPANGQWVGGLLLR